MPVAVARRAPVIVPDAVLVGGCTGESGAAARELFGVAIALAGRIADRQVGHEQIANRPLRRIRRRRVHADAEEGDLVAKAPAVRRLHVAGVVPPLDLVVRMRGVIARERICVAGGRFLPGGLGAWGLGGLGTWGLGGLGTWGPGGLGAEHHSTNAPQHHSTNAPQHPSTPAPQHLSIHHVTRPIARRGGPGRYRPRPSRRSRRSTIESGTPLAGETESSSRSSAR